MEWWNGFFLIYFELLFYGLVFSLPALIFCVFVVVVVVFADFNSTTYREQIKRANTVLSSNISSYSFCVLAIAASKQWQELPQSPAQPISYPIFYS